MHRLFDLRRARWDDHLIDAEGERAARTRSLGALAPFGAERAADASR